MKPTQGRIVILNLTETQQQLLGDNHNPKGGNCKTAPAIVVNVWSETCVNLKVIGDSNNNIWATSASQGDQPGQWNWPKKEEEVATSETNS